MQTLTQLLIDNHYADRVITQEQLRHLIKGSDQKRYHLLNRALKARELVRVVRGVYVLADKYKTQLSHPFHIAQNLMPGSYVSLETALSFHGWIPEGVYTTASIVSGRRSKHYETKKFGPFSFYPIAIQKGFFLELVRQENVGQHSFLMAKPLRALLDLMYINKIDWQGIEWLEEGLRIDIDKLESIKFQDIEILKQVYKSKRSQKFLHQLSLALSNA